MSGKKVPKKNIIKIPPNIIMRIKSLKKDAFIAGCALRIKTEDIQAGKWQHLGIGWSNGRVSYAPHVLPSEGSGRYSKRNLFGHEIVHTEEPKITKTFTRSVPNYGDWLKGEHDVDWDREVYRREWQHPKFLHIRIEHMGENLNGHSQDFRFIVEEVMDRKAKFRDQLLNNLNLLQENVGNFGIFESNASLDEYMRTLYVNWEILPPGEEEEAVNKIIAGVRSSNPNIQRELHNRYEVLKRLKPRNWVVGTSGFQGYFGGQFADDLVVLENAEYGNAIYVMFENWEELCKKTRTELLSSSNEGQEFVRIRHTRTWRKQLLAVLRAELKKRSNRTAA
jgi:hypothetical protein